LQIQVKESAQHVAYARVTEAGEVHLFGPHGGGEASSSCGLTAEPDVMLH
jgi:hypothetical protein